MKTIYVVGGNGFAKECHWQIELSGLSDKEIRFGGFVGHNGYKVDFMSLNRLFVGDLSEMTFGENDYGVVGAAYPELRRKIYDDLREKGLKPFNLVPFSDTYISEWAEVGEGNIIAPHCALSVHARIGPGNVFNGDDIIGHDVEIGDFNFFGPKSQILGDVKIGNMNKIGAGSVILPKARIGNNNSIAPLSAVYKGCKDNCHMLGNPALVVGRGEPECAIE
jgi:acetyltransferase-like isoleucine patch superfamily enzyme